MTRLHALSFHHEHQNFRGPARTSSAGTTTPGTCPFFYKTDPSPCAPSGPGLDRSDGDKRGLGLLYPHGPDAKSDTVRRAQRALDALSAEGVRAIVSSDLDDRLLELLAERAAL